MRKIKTVFQRDERTRKVVNVLDVAFDFSTAVATEKVDGTNVRVTVRAGEVVRLEKRRNPSKAQKAKGILEPWYVDANPNDPLDKWIFEALKGTDTSGIPDGEHSAEAVGVNIQGNPLKLDGNRLFFFSIQGERENVTFENVPTDFEELSAWLKQQTSLFSGNDSLIEGIVWHGSNGDMVKIKAKDFK
ncbi:DUF5565 family protein [Gorillibacterium sp. CAU 1737]|uniref:RNA ligase 1 family protein n=1 Tax=Gorillibacterium sp. CAU 1737 TaxID=3140362 RepID=UPI003260A592